MSSLRHKLKRYFRSGEASDSAVELLRMFILPFSNRWDPNASTDDAVGAFFAIDERKIYEGKAKRSFRMPGQYMLAGNKPTKRFGLRDVPKGKPMLIVIDRKSQTAKIDIILEGRELTFLLERPEMEFLKDQVEIRE